MTIRTRLSGILIAAAAWTLAAPAAQAEYPEQRMTLVTGGEIGGGMDLAMRAFGAFLQRKFGVDIRYENKPGASGTLEIMAVANSRPDGYTLLVSNLPRLAFLQALEAPFEDWDAQFSWVGSFVVDPGLLAVHKDSAWQTPQDFLAAAEGQTMRIATSNWAAPETVALLQMQEAIGTEFEIIPMGGKDSATALLGGHIEAMLAKYVRISTVRDSVRHLAIFQDENDNAATTDDAPPISEVMETEIVNVASIRSVLFPTPAREQHPERYQVIVDALAEMRTDPEFLADAKEFKFDSLLVDWDAAKSKQEFDRLRQSVDRYRDRF